jgi:hypothetical protein
LIDVVATGAIARLGSDKPFDFWSIAPTLMAEPDQLKKETVRIELSLPPSTKPSGATVKQNETVRIELPVRETGNPPILPSSPSGEASAAEDISSANFFQAPSVPAISPPLSASVRPPSVSATPGLKEETVRIPLIPEPLRSSQRKSQPLIAMPHVARQNPPIAVAPVEKSSMPLYWVLLVVSALILIIQIWIYFS